MYELVRKNVPYVLAGSIRDDARCPTPRMDLSRRREDYARLLDARKMVVLSVVNAAFDRRGQIGRLLWVRMVCVDINPRARRHETLDRGSQQTLGRGTDRGDVFEYAGPKVVNVSERFSLIRLYMNNCGASIIQKRPHVGPRPRPRVCCERPVGEFRATAGLIVHAYPSAPRRRHMPRGLSMQH